MFCIIEKIIRNEGWSSLWRGVTPTLIHAVPSTVIYFSSCKSTNTLPFMDLKYHVICYVIDDYLYGSLATSNSVMPSLSPMIAGCTARCLTVTLLSPLELLRTRSFGGEDKVWQNMARGNIYIYYMLPMIFVN